MYDHLAGTTTNTQRPQKLRFRIVQHGSAKDTTDKARSEEGLSMVVTNLVRITLPGDRGRCRRDCQHRIALFCENAYQLET